ncbi:hypothetical protein ASG63_14080 [Methylobacterium sp. Leaf94]|nr:hypothetical protein ASG63_14080 [Methylobacterium sp. Leaf94]
MDLYLPGSGGQNPALLYGMKTEVEDSYNKASPFYAEKAQWGGYLVMSFVAWFLLIGFVMVPYASSRSTVWRNGIRCPGKCSMLIGRPPERGKMRSSPPDRWNERPPDLSQPVTVALFSWA